MDEQFIVSGSTEAILMYLWYVAASVGITVTCVAAQRSLMMTGT